MGDTEHADGSAETEQLNQGDHVFGIDLDDEHCPDCGREVLRGLFTYRAYCPICDAWAGRLKVWLGLVDKYPESQPGANSGDS